jgi:Zn-dependent protease
MPRAMLCHHDRDVFGGGSLQLARILGIRVGVHLSWFAILFLAIVWLQQDFEDVLGDSTQGFIAAALASLLFFGSILLHELGHALAARREGIEVVGIELFFFGGLMQMSRDAATPGQEFRVSAAGPLVNVVIALVFGLAGIISEGAGGFFETARLSGRASLFEVVTAFFVSMNLLVLVLNLIPAFPLDGGRLLRAAAWKLTGDRGKATRVAAFLGQAFALALIGLGLYRVFTGDGLGGIWWVVLGWMLGGAARAAVAQSAVQSRLEGVTVADVMDADPVTIPAGLAAHRAFEDYFLRYQGWPWFAVVEEDGRYAGLAHRDAVEQAPPQLPVRAVAVAGQQVPDDEPLEALLGSEPLRRLGALMAVDAEGRLRGVVTLEQVSRALQTRLTARPS